MTCNCLTDFSFSHLICSKQNPYRANSIFLPLRYIHYGYSIDIGQENQRDQLLMDSGECNVQAGEDMNLPEQGQTYTCALPKLNQC